MSANRHPRLKGALELTWTNKDEALLSIDEGGSYAWVDPCDHRVAEVRLLDDVATYGEVGPDDQRAKDNLLIQGDALNALTCLRQLAEFREEYEGRVKLCYIDPPFNTEQSFAHYDDALEHSVWLTMMRDRLLQVRELLAPDGTVWVHLDDSEVHRARAVLDELFGLDNYLGTVIWQKADGPRNDLPNFSVDHDSILVYGRTRAAKLIQGERDHALNAIYKSADGDETPWYDDNPTAPSAIRNQTWVYAIQSPLTGELMYPADGRCWGAKQATVFGALSEYAPYELSAIDDDDRRAKVCGVPVDEVRKGISAIMLAVPIEEARIAVAQRQAQGPWPEFIIRRGGTIGRKRPQPTSGVNTRTLWFNTDVGHNREAKAEIKALFPNAHPFTTPKPERLLRRIIEVSTAPGDVVLDCFVGSGTTAGVAHKTGRRWIAIEREAETVQTYALPRLRMVIAGKDPGGISTIRVPANSALPEGVNPGESRRAAKVIEALLEAGLLNLGDVSDDAVSTVAGALRSADKTKREVKWSGGGGFRHLAVHASMFEGDETSVTLSGWAVKHDLARAVAAQVGMSYRPAPPFCGRKGRSRLAVIDGMVTPAVIEIVIDALSPGEVASIYGTSIDPDARARARELRPGSTVRKIPAAILAKYRQQSPTRRKAGSGQLDLLGSGAR